jgi:thioredoxin 1
VTYGRIVCLAAGAVLALAAGGCGGSRTQHLKETGADFQQQVLKADKPVLVDFYKEGCAACGALDPILDQLADEYRGRVTVAAFRIYTFFLEVTCPPIKEQYDISFTPTVVLFVNGQEKHRWIVDYNADAYRKVLNEVAGASAPEAKPAQPSAKP